jgi:hypothetical protein
VIDRQSGVAVLACLLLVVPAIAQTASQRDQATIVAAAQEVAIKAVNFRQGDPQGWRRAKADFTPEGWKEFVKWMNGWLDKNEAATFTSTFAPSRNAVVIGQENGVVHFRVPGTLTQTQNQSRTTYRAALEVCALRDLLIHRGEPIKIKRLEQITCVEGSNACQ